MRNSFPRSDSRTGIVLSDTAQGVMLRLAADPNYIVEKVRIVAINSADKDAYIFPKGEDRSVGLIVPASKGSREDIFPIGDDADYALELIVIADDAPTNGGTVRLEISPYEYGGRRNGS